MDKNFANLSKQQYDILVDAIPLITILIAGADGEINYKETSWAEKIAKIRTYAHHPELNAFYKDVGQSFSEKLNAYLENLPKDLEDRNNTISTKLAQINAIFPLIPLRIASMLYNSYTSFAEHVAKSSGGFFGSWAINKEESFWIGLPMIDPVGFFDEFEEE